MAARPAKHPNAEVLKAFGLGKLDDSSSGALMEHLDLCAACRQIVASQSGDDFLDRLRQALGRSGTPAPAKSLVGMEGKPKPPPGPTTLFNLPPELAHYGKYRFVRELGRGGMGVVYQAEQTVMARTVAVKVINPSVLDHPDALPRFQSEVRAAAKLDHPNIVRAYDAEQVGSMHLLVMEYIEGTSLAELVKKKGPLSIAYACHYVRQAALGLQHAFEQGMVHRDIKPQNLMVNARGQVKVLDFGLARMRSERKAGGGLTQADAFMGTPEYVSPEQATDARSADTRADIYSLGGTLFFLLTGRPPFQEDSIVKLILAQIEKEAPALHDVRPDVPVELSAVVARLLAKDPAQRLQTPIEVEQALAAFVKPGTKQPAAGGSASAPGVSSPRTGKVIAEDTSKIKAILHDVPGKAPAQESPASVFEGLGEAVVSSKKAKPARKAAMSTRKKWWTGVSVAVGLLLLGSLGYWLAAVLLRVETPNGTLIVEMNDDEVEARIKNGKLILSGPDGKVRYTLSPHDRRKQLEAGAYKIRVQGADGLVLDTTAFTIKKGGEVRVRVTMAERVVAKNTPASLAADRKAAEYVLSIGGIVRVNDEVDDTRAIAELPKEPFRLTYIDLKGNNKVRNAALACFQDCKHLREVFLAVTLLKDQGLAYFKHCKNLESLVLNDTWISDAGLAHFKDCKNLKILQVGHTIVSDAGLAHFKDCKNLRILDLNVTKVTEEGLVYFSGCKNLTDLYLYGVPVTGDFLAQFTDFSKLSEICLNFTKVTDADLAHLHNFKNLKFLQLKGTPVTDKGMIYIKDCKNLTGLYLEGTQVTDAGLSHIKDCKKLSRINLKKTKVTAAGIEDLKKALPTCEIEWDRPAAALPPPKAGLDPDRKAAEYVLSIGGIVRVNDEVDDTKAAADLPKEPFRLTYVNLGGNPKVRNAGLAAFDGCKNLTVLRINETPLKDQGLAYFKDCKNLEILALQGTEIGDAGLANFKGCTKVQELALNFTKATDVGLAYFSGCENLRTISLFAAPVTGNFLAQLKDCSKLEDLELEGTGFTDAALVHLQNCKNLVGLSLMATRVTDKGMVYLKDCKNLTFLGLAATTVGDEGLANFKDCKKLRRLRLHATQMTDKGLACFKGCENLEWLEQRASKITKAGLDDFRKALPKCQIDLQPDWK